MNKKAEQVHKYWKIISRSDHDDTKVIHAIYILKIVRGTINCVVEAEEYTIYPEQNQIGPRVFEHNEWDVWGDYEDVAPITEEQYNVLGSLYGSRRS